MLNFFLFIIFQILDKILISIFLFFFVLKYKKSLDFNFKKIKNLYKYFNYFYFNNSKYFIYTKLHYIKDHYLMKFNLLENFFLYFLYCKNKFNKNKKFVKKFKNYFFDYYNRDILEIFFHSKKIIISFHFYPLYYLFSIISIFNKNNILLLLLNEELKEKLNTIIKKYPLIYNKVSLLALNEKKFIFKIIDYINNDYDLLILIDSTFLNNISKSNKRNLIKINMFNKNFYFHTNIFNIVNKFYKKDKFINYYIFHYDILKRKFLVRNISNQKEKEYFVFNYFNKLLLNQLYFYNWELSDSFIYSYFYHVTQSSEEIIDGDILTKNELLNKQYLIIKANFLLINEKGKYYIYFKQKPYILNIHRFLYKLLKKPNIISTNLFDLDNKKIRLLFTIFVKLSIIKEVKNAKNIRLHN